MSAEIVDRGRGPEVAGTRVTVYRIMDYIRDSASPARIAEELHLTDEAVRAALEYIDQHRARIEAEYAAILQRLDRQRSAAATTTATADELKRRIRLRESAAPHADHWTRSSAS